MDCVMDSGPPRSGVTLNVQLLSLNASAPSLLVKHTLNVDAGSPNDFSNKSRLATLPDALNVFLALVISTKDTESSPNANWADAELSFVIVKLSTNSSFTPSSNATASTAWNGSGLAIDGNVLPAGN